MQFPETDCSSGTVNNDERIDGHMEMVWPEDGEQADPEAFKRRRAEMGQVGEPIIDSNWASEVPLQASS